MVLTDAVHYTAPMRRFDAAALTAFMILGTMGATRADVDHGTDSGIPGRSYHGITERNPFGLKPPTPVVPVAPSQPTNQVAKSDIKLTGFITLGGKRAFFMWTDDKSKKTESFSLAVDQERDGLRVLEIDEVARSVRVTEAGTEKLMTFASHGLTNAVAVAATGAGQPGALPGGGAVRGPGGAVPPPVPTQNVTPGSTPTITPPGSPGLRTIPSRNLRVQQDAGGGQPIMAGASAAVNVPGRGTNPGGLGGGAPIPVPQPSRNVEEQVLMMELQRTVNPDLPPTPPVR